MFLSLQYRHYGGPDLNKLTKILVGLLLSVLILLGSTLGVLYFGFGIDVFDRSGWDVDKDGQVRYLDYYGDPLVDWQLIDGNWYYFEPLADGRMATGWLEMDGHRYYLNETGIRATGWLELEEGTYYVSPSNGAVVTGWQTIDGSRYHMDQTTGRMDTGWLVLGDTRYYLDPDGRIHIGWLETEDGRYFLNDDGSIVTGWIETTEGSCYLDLFTGRAATGWAELDTGRHYFNAEGYLCTGWTDTEEGRFYLTDLGQPTTGWLDWEDHRYYLGDTGAMTVGWLDYESNRYYFLEDGTMAVGQITLEEVNHFFTSTGAYVVVVNKWNAVPEDYKPDLVTYNGYEIDRSIYEPLKAMFADLRKVGGYEVTSAYRSTATQKSIWNNRLSRYMNQGYSRTKAEEKVALEVAVPGTSEHHLGLAIDISAGEKVDNWLAENSWRDGFILRYPEGKTEVTGIIYEPWHFRYVGLELAKELYDLDLCLEEYMAMLTASRQETPPATDVETPAESTETTETTDSTASTEALAPAA